MPLTTDRRRPTAGTRAVAPEPWCPTAGAPAVMLEP